MGGEKSKSAATGSAAGSTSNNQNSALEHCAQPLGTLALLEDEREPWFYRMRSQYGVQSTTPVLRIFVQQSNCFVVVERGRGFSQIERERKLQNSGELRKGSKFNKGQLVAADYGLTPTLIFNESNTGGVGGFLGGMVGGSLGAVIGSKINFKDAQSMLALVDNRSGVQVSVSEGSARGTDIGGLGGLFGRSGLGGISAYAKTPKGKVVVASLLDAYNQMVVALRGYQPQQSAGDGGHGTGGKLKIDGDQSAQRPTKLTGMKQKVFRAQQSLNELGYQAGRADGIIGGKTISAIKLFQLDQGLQKTGRLDKVTLDLLLN